MARRLAGQRTERRNTAVPVAGPTSHRMQMRQFWRGAALRPLSSFSVPPRSPSRVHDGDPVGQLIGSSRYWVVSRSVVPSRRSSRTIAQISLRLRGSRPVVGSSRNRTRGRFSRLDAMSSRRRLPPEQVRAGRTSPGSRARSTARRLPRIAPSGRAALSAPGAQRRGRPVHPSTMIVAAQCLTREDPQPAWSWPALNGHGIGDPSSPETTAAGRPRSSRSLIGISWLVGGPCGDTL